MARTVITDEIWAKLLPLLPVPKGRHGKDDRNFLEAVCWIIRTGAPCKGYTTRIWAMANGL